MRVASANQLLGALDAREERVVSLGPDAVGWMCRREGQAVMIGLKWTEDALIFESYAPGSREAWDAQGITARLPHSGRVDLHIVLAERDRFVREVLSWRGALNVLGGEGLPGVD